MTDDHSIIGKIASGTEVMIRVEAESVDHGGWFKVIFTDAAGKVWDDDGKNDTAYIHGKMIDWNTVDIP